MPEEQKLCRSHQLPLKWEFTFGGQKGLYCDECLRVWEDLAEEEPGWLLKNLGQEGVDQFMESIAKIPPRPFICPYCSAPIHGIEWRPFGPGGILNLAGCKKCLKPFGVMLVPMDEAPAAHAKKSEIIIPQRPA